MTDITTLRPGGTAGRGTADDAFMSEKGTKASMGKVIAVDFDGVLFTEAYPKIGMPIAPNINRAKNARAAGAKLILWTCREGFALAEAIAACMAVGLEFDAINENLPETKERYGSDPRKVGADEYWDDKVVCVGGICLNREDRTMNVMLDEGAFLPTRAHDADAGLDLYTPEEFMLLMPSSDGINSQTVDTGVHVEIPAGYVGMIKSKSGLNVNRGIVTEGVIDAGYTGSIKVKLYNLSGDIQHFRRGDKIAQLVILPIVTPAPVVVNKFAQTERGDNGFGSTGR